MTFYWVLIKWAVLFAVFFLTFCSCFCLFWFTVQKLFEFVSSVILISLCHLRYCACCAACFSKCMVFEKMLVIFLVFVQILFLLLLLLLFLMNKRQKTFMIIVTWDWYLQTSVRAKTKFACLYVNYMYIYTLLNNCVFFRFSCSVFNNVGSRCH